MININTICLVLLFVLLFSFWTPWQLHLHLGATVATPRKHNAVCVFCSMVE